MKTAIAILILTSGLVAADDNYERSRQCAEQAEKHAAKEQSRLVQAHYSPKYQQCFALESRLIGKDVVTVMKDVYENFTVASQIVHQSDKVDDLSCEIRGTPKPCQAVYDFIVEHMDH